MELTFEEWVATLTQFAEDALDPTGDLEHGTAEFLRETFDANGRVDAAEVRRL